MEGRTRLNRVIEETKRLLGLPDGYRLAIVPGSDTGAFEMALWSLAGARGVDVFAWEVFGRIWVKDVVEELRLADVRVMEAEFGLLPDLAAADPGRDIVFTANGTTSGVRVPDYDWIASDRTGLTFCDATSAVFAQAIDWSRIDVATFSWQKCLGGEGGHGMLILSPRAIDRALTYTPPWPVPKLFRFVRDGVLDEALFEGQTINTPSMLCVEDWSLALAWARDQGGLERLIARADANAALIQSWIERTPWIANLANAPAHRSNTSVCLKIIDEGYRQREDAGRGVFVADLCRLLEAEGVAFDIQAHRLAPPGLRIWTGPTVERDDLEALVDWLDWAFAETAARHFQP